MGKFTYKENSYHCVQESMIGTLIDSWFSYVIRLQIYFIEPVSRVHKGSDKVLLLVLG